jgi:hypothetical protein
MIISEREYKKLKIFFIGKVFKNNFDGNKFRLVELLGDYMGMFKPISDNESQFDMQDCVVFTFNSVTPYYEDESLYDPWGQFICNSWDRFKYIAERIH